MQPQNRSVSVGASVTFNVSVDNGVEPLSYQWRRNEMALAGGTKSSLTLTNVQVAHAGSYTVVVVDGFNESVTSEPATLAVDSTFTKITVGPGSGSGKSYGAAWGDYNNDGFIDLFVANVGADGSSPARQFLYHNNTNGTFALVTNGPVATVQSPGRGAAWGDYDNDGNLDLFLGNLDAPNKLFHNKGAGSFEENSAPSFVSDVISAPGMTWVDYDTDGYLDLFRTALFDSLQRLHHNNHDGTFTQIKQGAFLTSPGTYISSAWGDYNNDGRPDLFLPNVVEADALPNYLYQNDGSGKFTRVGARVLDGNFNSTAAVWGDYDNDGDLDLFVACAFNAGQESRPNLFYRNDGNGTFTSITSLPANDPEYEGGASHGCNWGDYDNDGWLDLFVANNVGQNDFLYHNNGNGTFTKITSGSLVNDAASSWAAAWGDYDNDGFLDLFVSTPVGENLLYRNNGNSNHWLKFRLIGTRSNRAAIGAKVRVRATINGQAFWQMREVPGGEGTMGQNSLHVHFGLGNATNADLVRIEWPSGTVQELTNVPAQQFLTVTEPGGEPRLEATRENGKAQLTLTGKQGSRYAIETSTALPIWNSAGLTVTVTNQSGIGNVPRA